MALSPMMQQYMEIKEQHRDCILFFRLGDFYEMFFDDAIIASSQLELTLTGKNCGLEDRAPMCGVPFHSSESYISRLISKGYKVAVCEQIEDPATTKSLVKRAVVQIITPGTVTSGNILPEKENNYLASIFINNEGIGFCYCDISTGEIAVTWFRGNESKDTLYNELVRVSPKEVIFQESIGKNLDIDELKAVFPGYFTELKDSYYNAKAVQKIICDQWGVKHIVGIGLEKESPAVFALGGLLHYLAETQKRGLPHLIRPNLYSIGGHMHLDKSTIRNLELTETLIEKEVKGSLLWVLDRTHTSMGSRMMKKWLREPLNCSTDIKKRLDAVDALVYKYMMRNNLKATLKAIYDFERLAGRIACGTANGRDLIALKNSLQVLPDIKMDLEDSDSDLLKELSAAIEDLSHVYDTIKRAICDDPPFTVREGGLIKDGYSEELDALKYDISDAKQWIANLESVEKERTGIPKLKVGYNRVFGYYLEITKSNYDKIPENYIRKQTLANAERFITPELKAMEDKVLNAEVKINQKEYQLFTELRQLIYEFIPRIQQTSAAIAQIDVIAAFADVSDKMGYIKPDIHDGDEILLEKGRHPVIEHTMVDGVFVSNDTYIDKDQASMLLITGPNMAGKSTYMRQTALIVLMAQVGCFVPCERARIGVVDSIFTRIGASDNLAAGQSTFFVEMSELAYILNTATEKSLIILDEIGRGTSTYDGLSIAFAVTEFLCSSENRIRTMFASHYHELTVLEDKLDGFKNLNVDVSEKNGNIIFLHKIIEGSASRSYGIHVAKLAGIPQTVLDRANLKLTQLEALSEDMSHEEGLQLQFKW